MGSKLTLPGGVALVTGAASGIGKEVTFAFAEAGVEAVALADLNEAGAQQVADEAKEYSTYSGNSTFRTLIIAVDVTDEASVQTMAARTASELGRIDYFVNCAAVGITRIQPVGELDVDWFDKNMATNVRGTMLGTKHVGKIMAAQDLKTTESSTSRRRRGHRGGEGGEEQVEGNKTATTRTLGRGSIVNMGSIASYIPAPGSVPYIASKHAVIGATKASALDLFADMVRVNAVCPSWVDTPLMQAGRDCLGDLITDMEGMSMHKRAATAEEVADYIVFLCSPSASYINGTALAIDSGACLAVRV